jgi:hypothetical protein
LGLDLDQNTKTQKKQIPNPNPKTLKKQITNPKPKETQTNLLIKPTNCIHFKNQLIEFYKMM